MQRLTWRNRLVALLSAVLSILVPACAQQVGDIDRTQPNKIEKAAFEGEWYFRQTVVDVNATAVTTFVGLEGQMERIEFGIEEDYLVAYRTHEDVIGIDSQSLGPDEEFDHGQPVAAYPISGHFDVQRQYNAQTGEQTNVIVENPSDRPWYEREYMRVDWSQNAVVTAIDPMVGLGDIADLTLTPQDEGDNVTWFVERNDDGEVIYIDVLSQYVIEPLWIDCVLTFGFPLYGGECGPETVTVRSSFVRIDEESDYVPREYSDFDMNDFGFFRTERAAYDRRYGTRDENRIYLANRWNMWERSQRDDGTEIPYAERQTGQVVYYLSEHFPEDLKETAFAIAEDYDNAFRRIAATYKGLEVPDDPRGMSQVSYDEVPRIFYLCDNPGGTESAYAMSNEGYARGICQHANEVKSLGDLRYSYFAWVDQPQQDGPAGYGPSSADPLTGEIVSGDAYLYGAWFDTYAQYTLDLTKIMTGELDAEEYGYGRTVAAYFERQRQQADGDLYFGLVRDRHERGEHLQGAMQELLSRPRVQNLLSHNLDDFRLRNNADISPFERLRGTQLERQAIFPEVERHLMPPDYQQRILLGEMDPASPLDDLQVDALSLASIGDPVRMLNANRQRTLGFSRHGANQACVFRADLDDPALVGLARQLADERQDLLAQGMTEQEVDDLQFNTIRNGLVRYIMSHEVGHTVGLRHNFEASYDALNFGNEYWDLREQTFDRCDENAVTFSDDGFFSGDIAPPLCGDAANQETVEQYTQRNADVMQQLLEGRIHDYQYSSVMDYLPKGSTGWRGLGLYDYAALAFGYGELREVFDEAPHQLFVEVAYDPVTDNFVSSDVRQSSNLVSTFDDVDEYFIRRRNQIEGDDPRYLRDDELGHEHNYRYYHYSTLPIMFGGDVEAMNSRHLVPDSQVGQAVEVPYRFCSDEYLGASVECNVWDLGADFGEIYTDLATSWDEYYVTSFFRRGRAGFGLWLYPLLTRMYGRTMAPMTRLYQHWLIKASGRGSAWYNSSWGGEDATLAMLAAVDFLGNVITKPTVGTYYYDEQENVFLNLDDELDYRAPFHFEIEENIDPEHDYLTIGLDQGRYGFEQFRRNQNDEAGYYYFLETEVLSWFWAKWTAMMALTLPEVDVIGVDTASDSTAFSIPIYLIFEDELSSFFGAIPREDFDLLGTCVQMNENGRDPERILQTNIASGQPDGCAGAARINPYTSVYGNSDFNVRLLSILYSAAYFQTNYSPSWFDRSNIYVLGRGYNLEPAEGFSLAVYEHDNGIQYAALAPTEIEAGQDADIWVGMQLVNRAQEFRDLRDAELEANGESDAYFEYRYQLENLLEDMRLMSQANELFEGYNVFVPFSL